MDSNLRKAIEEGNIKYVKEYIDTHGVSNINVKCNGWTFLYYAVYRNQIDIIKFLLDNGADIEAKIDNGWTPLYLAVYNGQIETTKYLISKGANINTKTNDGWTPLHSAAFSDSFEMVKLLLTHGANREIKNDHDRRPIDLTKNKEIITLLETWQDLPEIKEPDI